MKAALLKSIKTIEISDIDVPKVTPNSVLIKVKSCGICGSDLKFFNYGDRVKEFPAILGHEIAGEVVEVGRDVDTYSVGDRVALGNEIPCKNCAPCKKGFESVCDNVQSVGTTIPGGLCEYMLIPEKMVQNGPISLMPKNVSFDEGALAEPLGCVVNGLEFAKMQEGKTVLIVGTGPIGAMMINVAKIQGASKVVIVDKNPKRLDMVRKFGADHYINSENFLNEALSLSNGNGYDVVMSACSDNNAHNQAVMAVAKGGAVNLFGGVAKGLPDNISFSNNFTHYRQCYVGGSFSMNLSHHKKALEYISMEKIQTKNLITHKYSLEQILDGFDAVQNSRGLKVMINP
jgi:L-iditol 2-dehydrogenase